MNEQLRDELAAEVHDAMCGQHTSPSHPCARFRDGNAHKDFYELRAQNLIASLEPVIGLANVPPVVRIVLLEVEP